MVLPFIRKWLARLFKRSSALEPVTPVDAAPTPRKPRAKVQEDLSQAHYYMGDLLEQLETYFADFEYLKRGNPEMASVFEKFGVSLSSSNRLTSVDLEPSFYKQMPAMGCFYGGRNDTSELLTWRFMYFQKRNRPVNVQFSNHTVYEIGGVWGVKERHFFQFYVSVDDTGIIRVLKQVKPVHHKVGKYSRRNGGYTRGHIFRMEWAYPSFLLEWVADRNSRRNEKLTVDEFAADVFTFLANLVRGSEFDMNVRVKKNGRVATFAINMLRTPYFFSDREKTKNENGSTVRILHIVRPHMRNGKAIKAHWRGERKFMWNGYSVSIGMPGKHFAPLSDFAAAAWEEADVERLGMKNTIPADEAARRIDRIVSGEQDAA